jgi:hypothetical protein
MLSIVIYGNTALLEGQRFDIKTNIPDDKAWEFLCRLRDLVEEYDKESRIDGKQVLAQLHNELIGLQVIQRNKSVQETD